jgi:hypothetical protein
MRTDTPLEYRSPHASIFNIVKALRYSSDSLPPCVPSVDLLADEWCEWERTTLRTAKTDKQGVAALEHLEYALAHKAGPPEPLVHSVGLMDTFANVVVAVTLDSVSQKYSSLHVPLLVTSYIKAHAVPLAAAKELAQQWHDAANVSKLIPFHPDNPLLQPVVTAIFQQAAMIVAKGGEDLLTDAMVGQELSPKYQTWRLSMHGRHAHVFQYAKGGQFTAVFDITSRCRASKAIMEAVAPKHLAVMEQMTLQQSHLCKWLAGGPLPQPPVAKNLWNASSTCSVPTLPRKRVCWTPCSSNQSCR